jgi:error-prone DNA polymerase
MPRSGTAVPYVELHSHSAYSFLDGASEPAELAAAAADLGYEALALTDHDNVCGAMEFAHACVGVGIRPIVGCELTVECQPPGPRVLSPRCPPPCGMVIPRVGPPAVPPAGEAVTAHVTLLVESVKGWSNLCRLITEAHAGTRPKPGRDPLPPAVALEELETHAEGLVCLSGCAGEGAVAGRWERGDPAGAEALARRLLAAFGRDRFRIELQRPLWRRDRARNRWLASLAETLRVACVASGDVHAHHSSRARLQDALVSVRLGSPLDETEGLRRGNSASVLLRPADARERFRDHPEAVAESARLAERLRFDLTSDLGYSYPGAEDETADRRLAELCRARREQRYGQGSTYRAEAERRLEEELALIRKLRLSGFFLLHHDMLELAREVAAEVRGPESARRLLPPGRGRGSSVSSLVCYLTGLSHIDPVENDLFLGRFLNEELTDVPDIDLDFPRDIREKLIPRVHERYGPERSALVAAFATYRARGAVRDLGKALGLPPGEVERLARAVDVYEASRDAAARMDETLGRLRARSPRWRALAELLPEIAGLPRHISQHPGGMVIATGELVELCPVQPAAMDGRQMVQWDKDSCADAGFLKIDLLGLGMLSAVERCVDEIARARGERIDLSQVPLDDGEVWGAIQRAETTGAFQIESRAQMQMLPRTLPQDLDDLTVQVALVRPGPIQGGAVHPYIERRKRLREDPSYEVPYEHPSLEPVLRDTLGAIVFQDQVLEVAIALAGFSVGEAEGLRRAMSRKRSEAALRRYRERFIEGAVGRGVERAVAERVYGQIEGFSGFGFPKSHSAAFGLLAYQSTWLRVHYGPELLCALLNEQPMGFYPPDALVHEAQRRGIEVLPPDANASEVECRVETVGAASGSAGQPPVRIGLGYVAEVAEADAEAVVAERLRGGAYRSVADLAGRSGATGAALQRLAWAGACDRLVRSPVPVRVPVQVTSAAGPGEDPGPEEVGLAGATTPPVDPDEEQRRPALWEAGGAARASRTDQGTQLALALDATPSPPLPPLGPWERIVADYRTTGMTLGEHPMTLMRPGLGPEVADSARLAEIGHGRRVRVAGMVVARQRPATANGIVFMLLEDERGTINLIVPPPVVERCRVAIRSSGFVLATGRLEHREGTTNVVISTIERLGKGVEDREGLPSAPARAIAPPVDRETGRDHTGRSSAERFRTEVDGVWRGGSRPSRKGRKQREDREIISELDRPAREQIVAELAAAVPVGHSFGRRGR